MRASRTCVVLLVGLLLAPGCCKPLRVITDSHVTADVMPSVRSQPVVPMPLCGTGSTHAGKIALIDVDGLLLNSDMSGLYSNGENPVAIFHEKLQAAARDKCVRGVVVRINSYGGGVTATDIMWRDLSDFKAATGMPVVACLMDVATGGAYYLATAADQIFAHPTSVTGGIGVILNLYNLQDTMAQFNIVGLPIKAGEHVDLGTSIEPLSEESEKLLQDMADEFHARFRRIVEESRPMRDPNSRDDFDGRVFTAQQAQQRGLIDNVGYLDDAIQAARVASGCENAAVVLLHRCKDKARTPYDITPNTPLQSTLIPISIPGFERSKLPTFLYIWQPEPTIEKLAGK